MATDYNLLGHCGLFLINQFRNCLVAGKSQFFSFFFLCQVFAEGFLWVFGTAVHSSTRLVHKWTASSEIVSSNMFKTCGYADVKKSFITSGLGIKRYEAHLKLIQQEKSHEIRFWTIYQNSQSLSQNHRYKTNANISSVCWWNMHMPKINTK